MTGKLFEYLATENPILCIGDKKADAVSIIEKLENSIALSQFQIKEITQFIELTIKKNLVTNPSTLDVVKFSRYETARELSELIKTIENI